MREIGVLLITNVSVGAAVSLSWHTDRNCVGRAAAIAICFVGTLVALVQTLVFSLLTAIYIALATEEHEHHGHDEEHGSEAHA